MQRAFPKKNPAKGMIDVVVLTYLDARVPVPAPMTELTKTLTSMRKKQ